ncbi:MAG TPA: FKBP-type peptidyl-prolyl cis-trans isomerase [Candidatus Saccharimonadales bacterium]|nr:FKBP-type peptidyl-prolyl cis-trans isomerase [Candidatus Saccharimonadales bacterium]
MATKTSQRVFIWVIAIVLTIGTIGTYAALVLGTSNQSSQAAEQQQLIEQYKQQIYDNNLPLDGYQAESFNAKSVDQLKVEDLKAGDGPVAKASDKLTVSYFGWTPDGKIFDSSNKKDGTGQPYSFTPSEGGVIAGWVKGLPGMKAGGVRLLSIPADQAYGSTGSPPLIPANTPLKFIVRLDKIGS